MEKAVVVQLSWNHGKHASRSAGTVTIWKDFSNVPMAACLWSRHASQILVGLLHPKMATMVIALLSWSLDRLANPSATQATRLVVLQTATLVTSRVLAVSQIRVTSFRLQSMELAGTVRCRCPLGQRVNQRALAVTR